MQEGWRSKPKTNIKGPHEHAKSFQMQQKPLRGRDMIRFGFQEIPLPAVWESIGGSSLEARRWVRRLWAWAGDKPEA